MSKRDMKITFNGKLKNLDDFKDDDIIILEENPGFYKALNIKIIKTALKNGELYAETSRFYSFTNYLARSNSDNWGRE